MFGNARHERRRRRTGSARNFRSAAVPSSFAIHRSFAKRLRFEPLEDRRLLSITVNPLVAENDGVGMGAGTSLREAVAAAVPGDTINFSVTGVINLSFGTSDTLKQI